MKRQRTKAEIIQRMNSNTTDTRELHEQRIVEVPRDTLAWGLMHPKIPEELFQEQCFGTCRCCHKLTNDWWFYDKETNECECRSCYRKYLEERRGGQQQSLFYQTIQD